MDLSRGLGHSPEAIALSHVMGVLDTICLVIDCRPWGLGLPAMNQQARLHWLPAKRPSCCHPPGLSKLPPASFPTCLQLKATLTNAPRWSLVQWWTIPFLIFPLNIPSTPGSSPRSPPPGSWLGSLLLIPPHLSDLEVWGWGLHPPLHHPPSQAHACNPSLPV